MTKNEDDVEALLVFMGGSLSIAGIHRI